MSRVRCATELRAGQYEHLDGLVVQVRIDDGRVGIDVSAGAIALTLRAKLLPEALATVTLTVDVRLTRTGRVVRLVQKDGRALVPSAADPSQAKLLATAHRWWSILKQGELTIGLLAAQEGVTSSWMTRVLRLAFLSPKLTEAILSGTLPASVNGLVLVKTDALPGRWDDQHDRFLTC